jgi:hypothetical protein
MNLAKIRREFFEYYTKELDSVQIFNWWKDKLTPKKRSLSQNRALHLYFNMLSEQLNNAGYTFVNIMGIETHYTPELIKEMIWKPLQLSLYNIKSTSKINTKQINEIIDIFSLHFGEKGIYIEFPNYQSFICKLENNY